MLTELNNFYLKKEEPVRSCLLAMRKIILVHDPEITEAWKYGMPFFCIKKKMFCYLWARPKTGQPYLGVVDGNKMESPDLIQEKRSRMKILLLDPKKDLPVRKINSILKKAIELKRKV